MDESADGDRTGEEGTDRDDAAPDAADPAGDGPSAADDPQAVPDDAAEDASPATADAAGEEPDQTDESESDATAEESDQTGESESDATAEESDQTGESESDEADEESDSTDESEPDESEEEPDGDVDEAEDGTGSESETEPESTPLERKTSGPSMDEEQPLAEHIEEMVKRLALVVVVAGLVSVVVFPFAEDAINFLWYSILPGTDVSRPHVYHPLELLLTQLKVASLVGLIVALPVFVYETYAFMRPGLYPHERRYYLAAVPTSLVLAFVGVTFAYFVVLPAVMSYFLYYSQDVANIAFALGQTFDLILLLMGYLAIVFQIPLFIMLAIMMGLTSRRWLADRRLIFWGAFAGISFLFSPDPTGMAPALVALTMILLFEGTLLLLRWTGR